MNGPKAIRKVILTGQSLSLEEFVAVARFGASVELAPQAREAMERSRALAEKIADEKRAAYGITTGFGDFASVAVPEELSNKLSTNLILSHCTGTGEPYREEQVRGMMLLRANALCVGISGVRSVLVEMLIEMLNKGVTPVIPQKGSLGASGDLAPLSHMGLVLLGRGEAVYQGRKLPGGEAMALAGIPALDTLVCKEGLGITNGTCAMTSVGALNLYDTFQAAQLADLISSLTLTALTGQLSAFQERMHTARGHIGQIQVAKNLRLLTDGCEILERCQGARIQDAYALRCIPQVHGAVRDALTFIKSKVDIELNAVTDNPLLFCEDEAVISGGNFHGEPMALPFDFLGIALSELANISERRLERLVNPNLGGFPAFLVKNGGLNSGFMIVQYSAAALVSENKVLAHPASVDSIPSSAGQEDHVSMGTIAARKAAEILANVRRVLAMEMMCACQAVDLMGGAEKLGRGTKPAYRAIRQVCPMLQEDRPLYEDINRCEALLTDGSLVAAVEAAVGEL